MSFLAPLMLAGTAAAAIPVILHLFYRSRYRTVPWAAMKFLLTSIEQTSRRLRFQELLLLVVRTLLLALLAFALARPSSMARKGTAEGDAVDAVLLVDASMSMGAREGALTRLERAKQAALVVIDRLPAHSTVQVFAVADRASLLGPVAASNLEQAREAVRSIELSHLATDFLPGAQEAAEALLRGHSPNQEVYLFSDLQRTGWEAQPAPLKAKLEEISKKASITLVRCGTRAPRNVAVAGIAAQSGIPHTGERAGFAVLVRNSGSEPVRDVTVTLEVEGRDRQKESRAIPALAPGETQAVTLSGRLEKAGFRVVTAQVSADELEADNRFQQVLHVRDQARVLVVEGTPSEQRPESASSFYLLHSLRPVPEAAWGAYHLQPRAVNPAEASPALLGDMDLCILANVPLSVPGESSPGAVPSEFVERLARFVREGRGLLVFAGPRVLPELYNRVLFEEHGLLPWRISGIETAPAAAPIRPDPLAGALAPFLAAFREEPLVRVSDALVTQWAALEERETADSRVALRYTNRKAAVATRRVGAGEVVLVTTTADPRWTDWPLRHTYLPFVHVALGRLLDSGTERHNRTAGQPLRWNPPAPEGNRVYVAVEPDGRRVRLGVPAMVEGQPVVTAPGTWRAGVYRVLPEGAPAEERAGEGAVFAVAPDLRESENLEALSEKEIDDRLGIKVKHVTAGEDLSALAGAERLKQEWTLWVLLAVFLLVAFETVLAWYCGRGW
jgi:hypothetical protein